MTNSIETIRKIANERFVKYSFNERKEQLILARRTLKIVKAKMEVLNNKYATEYNEAISQLKSEGKDLRCITEDEYKVRFKKALATGIVIEDSENCHDLRDCYTVIRNVSRKMRRFKRTGKEAM